MRRFLPLAACLVSAVPALAQSARARSPAVERCEDFGVGGFKLPGSDTCFKIGGLVETSAGFASFHNSKGGTLVSGLGGQAGLLIDASTPTPLGPLSLEIGIGANPQRGQR